MQARGFGGPLSRWLTAAGAFVLAVVVRGLNHPAVITGEGVRPFGADAYYHLRRIQWDLLHFPQYLSFDPYLAPPAGGHSIWTPAFDWLLAGLALVTVGRDDWPVVELGLMWVPPLLGGATVVVLHVLAYPRFGPRVAGLAATLLALLPAHVYYSQIGFVDHHAAVALSSALLLLGVLSFLSRSDASAPPTRAGLATGGWLGLLIGACLLLWPGSLLHVGALEAALLSSVLGSRDSLRARTRARLLTLTHAVAFALVLPFCLQPEDRHQWNALSPVTLSYFQPWLLASATLCFGVLALPRLRGVSESRLGRTLLGLTAASLCLGVSLLVISGLWEGALDALQWFTRSESFQVVVNESMPLTRNLTHALAYLSGFVFVAPLLIVALALSARRDRRAGERWTIAWWGLVLFAATLAQWRFFNSFALPLALVIAWGWIGVHDLVTRRLAALGMLRVAAHAVTAAAAIALLSPASGPFRVWLAHYPPGRTALRGNVLRAELISLATWLRGHSPETSGYLDQGKRPEYTLLGAWGDGHVLRYFSRRAPVTDNFGNDVSASNFEAAERYFAAQSEDEALAVAAPLRVRYVVVRRSGSGHRSVYQPGALFYQLYRLGGSAGGLRFEGAVAPRRVPALTRHRQIYASSESRSREPLFRVFEIVTGAQVVGETESGSAVVATLDLRGSRGQTFSYESYTRADEQGHFELRLPYATDRPAGDFGPLGPYEIRSGHTRVWVAVPERSVRRGETISAGGRSP